MLRAVLILWLAIFIYVPVVLAEPHINKPVHLEELELSCEDYGGKLILSASPEYVKKTGILYRDVVLGENRVLYYHVNETGVPGKAVVLLTNNESVPTVVKVHRGGLSISKDYLVTPKEVQSRWFGKELAEECIILPGESRVLTSAMTRRTVGQDELVYGTFDFSVSSPVKLTVAMCPLGVDPADFVKKAMVLPSVDKEAGRGTFQHMNRRVFSRIPFDANKGKWAHLILADDPGFMQGVDATDGSKVVNYGNYGVMYNVEIGIRGQQSVRVYFNPIGLMPYAGAVRLGSADFSQGLLRMVPYKRQYYSLEENGGIDKTSEGYFLTSDAKLTDLGRYKGVFNMFYSPSGACNLPVQLVLIPE